MMSSLRANNTLVELLEGVGFFNAGSQFPPAAGVWAKLGYIKAVKNDSICFLLYQSNKQPCSECFVHLHLHTWQKAKY